MKNEEQYWMENNIGWRIILDGEQYWMINVILN